MTCSVSKASCLTLNDRDFFVETATMSKTNFALKEAIGQGGFGKVSKLIKMKIANFAAFMRAMC